MRLFFFSLCLSTYLVQSASVYPFVILPPFIRNGTTNSIIVTPIKTNDQNVDINLVITAVSGSIKTPVFSHKYTSQRPGAARTFKFNISTSAELAQIKIEIKRHATFTDEVRIRPDIGAIHLHTGKNIYRAGETVEVRALPLTGGGSIFTEPVDVTLVNPDGYELTRHRITASKSQQSTFVPLQFELPLHLFFGEWRIVASPAGFRDLDLTYETSFAVRDYELPPFQLKLYLGEDDPLDKTGMTVEASYFHGTPVDGTLVFYCSPRSKNHSTRSHRLLQTEISGGFWAGRADLSPCFDSSRLPTSITVEARDKGTGGRGELSLEYDPLRPGFDIVPMRPAFDNKTNVMLFVTQPLGAPANSSLKVQFSCLSGERVAPVDLTTKVGSVVQFEIPLSWNICLVIMVQAHRSLNTDQSRFRILMIPSVTPDRQDKPVVEASWITVKYPKAVYSVGEQLQITVPAHESKKLNYMVLANSHAVVASGRIRDDGVLSISLSSKFLGRCVLFAYSTSHTTLADMIQFYVKDNCSASVFSSRNEMKPGQNVTFTLNGDPYGMAVLRATDDRLNYIQSKAESQKSRSWDFGMFDKGDAVTHRHSQAKLANFVRVKELRNIIEKKCQKAAVSYKTRFGKCPEAKVTSSCISNHCIKWMVEACLHPPEPTTSSVCNENNQSGCPYSPDKLRKSGFGFPGGAVVYEMRRLSGTPALSDPGLPIDEPTSEIRENFEEIWLFDSYGLGASGTTAVTAKSPDSIGKWSVSSAFWSPGQQELCPAAGIHVLSRKKVFMQVDLPRNIYVNETITVKISVSALNLESEAKYSICMSEMSRKVCGDLGSLGQHGRPTYTRVVVDKSHPTDTKTFTIRFLATGPAAVLFRLRKEESFPGKHHCEVGEILDAVKLKFFVAKRAETEEHTKQLILNAEKPLATAALNDAFEMENTIPAKNIIEVAEYRSPIDPQAVVTQVAASIHDTDTVYSFSVDLSKFLTSQLIFKEDIRRAKRGVLDYGNSFLSDVIKQLSIELYSFKRARMTENTDVRTLEYAENKIGTLISDLLRFSDCSNETACGFAEYGRPQTEDNRSPLLTSTVASLLCEASADERLVCGAVGYLIKYLLDREMRTVDLHDMVDIDNLTDRQWFLNAMILQVSKDCAANQCTKNDAAWSGLYRDFYNLDESRLTDDRSIAAVAYMGPNGTVEILRPKMGDTMNTAVLPYWTAGNSIQRVKSKSSSFDRLTQYRKIKSGDLLVNALGVLAFVSAGAESSAVDWDPLANWIFEQQTEDGSYETALDTYFAHRALYEYRSRKVEVATDGNLQVIVDCLICPQRTINITETATEIYLPTSARNFTLTTKGKGKVKAGVRVLLTKRQRSRRGLTMDDYYPVRITIDQESVTTGIIKQIVCLRIMSPMLKTIEITHGFFTGYSSKASHVNILTNSTHMKLSALPTISSYAAHFILENLEPKMTQCYEVGVVEPRHNHEPIHLAPVAIVARHPINDVVGLVLISHPDQRRKRRSSTSSVPIRIENHRRPRKPRNVVDESIDTVCLSGGTCTCAETTCGVPCGMCKKDSRAKLNETFSQPNAFGAMLQVSGIQRILVEAAYYHQIETKIIGVKGGKGYLSRESQLIIWLRDCNPRCVPGDGITRGNEFFIQGDTEALVHDADGRQHYVLRDMDRWEISSSDCGEWTSAIFLK